MLRLCVGKGLIIDTSHTTTGLGIRLPSSVLGAVGRKGTLVTTRYRGGGNDTLVSFNLFTRRPKVLMRNVTPISGRGR